MNHSTKHLSASRGIGIVVLGIMLSACWSAAGAVAIPDRTAATVPAALAGSKVSPSVVPTLVLTTRDNHKTIPIKLGQLLVVRLPMVWSQPLQQPALLSFLHKAPGQPDNTIDYEFVAASPGITELYSGILPRCNPHQACPNYVILAFRVTLHIAPVTVSLVVTPQDNGTTRHIRQGQILEVVLPGRWLPLQQRPVLLTLLHSTSRLTPNERISTFVASRTGTVKLFATSGDVCRPPRLCPVAGIGIALGDETVLSTSGNSGALLEESPGCPPPIPCPPPPENFGGQDHRLGVVRSGYANTASTAVACPPPHLCLTPGLFLIFQVVIIITS